MSSAQPAVPTAPVSGPATGISDGGNGAAAQQGNNDSVGNGAAGDGQAGATMAPVIGISKEVDLQRHPVTEEAYTLYRATSINEYTDAKGRPQREYRRHYMPVPDWRDLAAALGRQVTKEEMELLIGLDGEPVTCVVTGRKFQPVWWTIVTGKFLDAVHAAGKVTPQIIRSHGVKVGMFFQSPDRKVVDPVAVSGVPFFWNKNTETLAAFWSPLRDAYKLNGHKWGWPREVVEGIAAERTAKLAQEQEREQGLNRLGDFLGANGSGQQGPDRRQKFRPGQRQQ